MTHRLIQNGVVSCVPEGAPQALHHLTSCLPCWLLPHSLTTFVVLLVVNLLLLLFLKANSSERERPTKDSYEICHTSAQRSNIGVSAGTPVTVTCPHPVAGAAAVSKFASKTFAPSPM